MAVLPALPGDVVIEVFGDVRAEEVGVLHLKRTSARVTCIEAVAWSYDVIHTVLPNGGMHFFVTKYLISWKTKTKKREARGTAGRERTYTLLEIDTRHPLEPV